VTYQGYFHLFSLLEKNLCSLDPFFETPNFSIQYHIGKSKRGKTTLPVKVIFKLIPPSDQLENETEFLQEIKSCLIQFLRMFLIEQVTCIVPRITLIKPEDKNPLIDRIFFLI
jgi:hypothetical protein